MNLGWIIFVSVYILVDIYTFQAVKTLTSNKWIHFGFFLVSLAVLIAFIVSLNGMGDSRNMTPFRMYSFGSFIALFIPKLLLIVVILFGEDLYRIIMGLYAKFFGESQAFYIPERRRFISIMALGLAALPFGSLLYGMVKGRYNYKVLSYEMTFDDLPDAFDGYTITQISDIHSGSFTNAQMVNYAVDLANKQNSDIILFTGDLVNDLAVEMKPWQDVFSTLSAPDGIYSVLGNHDYGDYYTWPDPKLKEQNLENLKQVQAQMGWKLLLNEHTFIAKGDQKIALVGVENWGKGRFKKAGDLNKAVEGLDDHEFKILMSHDPSHWREEVIPHKKKIQLTLSGHTHGMQFGFEIPGLIKWSPVKYRYNEWAGIYKQGTDFLNVNRGFGFIGYPGRVGIWPEISVITLKKGSNSV